MSSSSTSSLRSRRTRNFKSEINVVPYIDVMLVLLVIFMVAAPLTTPDIINLPTAGKSAPPPSDYIQISVQPHAPLFQIGLNGKIAESAPTRAHLMEKLHTMHTSRPELAVMISGDKEIRYDEIIQIISEAKKLGITRVGLATRQ